MWTNWQDPFLINCECELGTEITQTTYSLVANSGGFIEGDFEGFVPITPNCRGTFWITGSWLEAQGTGRIDARVALSTILHATAGSQEINDSRVKRSYYALGLGLEAFF